MLCRALAKRSNNDPTLSQQLLGLCWYHVERGCPNEPANVGLQAQLVRFLARLSYGKNEKDLCAHA